MQREKLIARRIAEDISSDGFPHPVLARIYSARDVHSPEQLEYALKDLHTPTSMKGISRAVELLTEAIQQQKRILIVADFDVDGATSCVVAIRALHAMGASAVDFLIPNRFKHGYGLTPEIVALATEKEPALIVTVDNGISSIDGVDAAHKAGIAVLITDHHLPGATLPTADAIVNPNQPDDEFPSKNLAGVGVIYYVMLSLRAHLREQGWFTARPEPNLATLLDLVALGTVSDMVPFDLTNRSLVAQGLKRINQGRSCLGVQAIINVAGLNAARISAERLAFHVTPRLNAAGRLDDMSLGIRCLLSNDLEEATRIAKKLDKLNRERQTLQREMHAQALHSLQPMSSTDTFPKALCLYNEGWHQGITGLVAGYVKEKIYRPVIAFAPFSDEEIKGSARSINGMHIRNALENIANDSPHILKKFGGHAMAAGLTLKKKDFEEFSGAFQAEAEKQLSDGALQETILTDGELEPGEINLELAELLNRAGPWGQGFPQPLFDGIFEITRHDVINGRHLKLSLRREHHGRIFEAIAVNYSEAHLVAQWRRVRVVYRLDVNTFRARQKLQILLEYVEEAEDAQDLL